MRIAVFIACRNEEKFLPFVLKALQNQTVKVGRIVVVNDGSHDRTSKIAREFGCEVIDLPDLGYNKLGMPELGWVKSQGMKACRKYKPDYAITLDGDHILPPKYIERLIEKMDTDPELAVASGSIKGERRVETHPAGSGRIMSSKFLDLVDWEYPYIFGWETYFVYKAMKLGYKTRCFSEIFSSARPTFVFHGSGKKAIANGRAMHVLGYFPLHVLARVFLFFLRSPSMALYMLCGYLIEHETCDLAGFVRNWQRLHFGKHFIKRFSEKVHW